MKKIFPILFLLILTCSEKKTPYLILDVEIGLKPVFNEIVEIYSNQYKTNFIVSDSLTSRELIMTLRSSETSILITRPLLIDEVEYLSFGGNEIITDTLAFSSFKMVQSVDMLDENIGYLYLWNQQKMKNDTITTIQYPILHVYQSKNIQARKFSSFFQFRLPNTLLEKQNLIPYMKNILELNLSYE